MYAGLWAYCYHTVAIFVLIVKCTLAVNDITNVLEQDLISAICTVS